jgi:hypothetical protein
VTPSVNPTKLVKFAREMKKRAAALEKGESSVDSLLSSGNPHQ